MYEIFETAWFGELISPALWTLGKPKKAPVPFKMIKLLVIEYVKEPEPSCGATGLPHWSSGTPCQDSSQVTSPKSFWNVPSWLNMYKSS